MIKTIIKCKSCGFRGAELIEIDGVCKMTCSKCGLFSKWKASDSK